MSRQHKHQSFLNRSSQFSSSVLSHYTANTGHLSVTPRNAVANQVVDLLLPLAQHGGGYIPKMPDVYIGINQDVDADQIRSGWATFKIGSGPFKSNDDELPWVVGVGCWDSAYSPKSWAVAHFFSRMYLDLGLKMQYRMPIDAPNTPWLSVILLPAPHSSFFKYMNMLGDLERCLFWTLAEARN
jgi:hypothetical protein